MSNVIPEKYLDLLKAPNFANLATVMPDGSPQVTPVWFEFDGSHIIINTAKGRVKDKNMRRTPKVSVSIMDPKNPYRYIEVRGKITEVTEKGADAHIDKQAKRYLHVEKYPYRAPGEVRVLFKVKPEKTSSMG